MLKSSLWSLSVVAVLQAGALGCSSSDAPSSPGTAGAPAAAAGSGASGAPSSVAGAPAGGALDSGGSDNGLGGAPVASGGDDTGTGGAAAGSDSIVAGSPGVGGDNTAGGASAGSGTGGASGGSAGAGTAGAGTTTGCASGLKLCDDFESGALGSGTSPWTTSTKSGYTVALVTDQAHSGTHSVHVMAPTPTGDAMIQETKSFPATDFWGRAWLRFNAPTGGHQMFIALNSANDQIRMLNQIGTNKIQVNLKSTDKSIASATVLPSQTWFCYEFHIAPNSVNIYVNGKQLTDASATFPTSNLTSLSLGYQRFQAGTSAGEVWIDDVAVNTTQVGCN